MPDIQKTTILVAEDKEVFRLGLKQLINEVEGCELIGYSEDGPSTIEKTALLKPLLLFIKRDLPIVDGVKTSQQIKRRFPSIRIILLLDHESDFFLALESGADGYILRETPEDLMSAAIQTVMRGGAWIGPLIARYLMHGDGLAALRSAAFGAIEVSGLAKLSPREKDVIRLLVKGTSNLQIAHALSLEVQTVKVHLRNIFRKLEVSGRAEVISKVLEAGRLL